LVWLRKRGFHFASSTKVEDSYPEEFATNVYMWDCELVGGNENIKLLSSKKDPSVLIKMQRDPTKKHVAEQMENEASIYKVLSRNTEVREALPSFRGFSNHLGVVMLCTGREGLTSKRLELRTLLRSSSSRQ
jgi:hypothetical protein